MEEYTNNTRFETMKCIINVGLPDIKARLFAWDHNTYNEYRMSLTFIQRVRFIHNEFEEKCGGDKTKVSLAFWKGNRLSN